MLKIKSIMFVFKPRHWVMETNYTILFYLQRRHFVVSENAPVLFYFVGYCVGNVISSSADTTKGCRRSWRVRSSKRVRVDKPSSRQHWNLRRHGACFGLPNKICRPMRVILAPDMLTECKREFCLYMLRTRRKVFCYWKRDFSTLNHEPFSSALCRMVISEGCTKSKCCEKNRMLYRWVERAFFPMTATSIDPSICPVSARYIWWRRCGPCM